jgi:prepilin-type N-terminal cleavage/methylation domain-containing protein
MKKFVRGFNLLELMVVLAIVTFLSMLAMPSFVRFFAKAKRTEAYTQLRALYMAQKAYFAEHGHYTPHLVGSNGLGWKAEGKLQYTYGVSQGNEGKNYVVGSLKAPASTLNGTYADLKGFKMGAAGDIDGDGDIDFLTINHEGDVLVERDDLA